jgi:hypothetical protein
MKVKNKSYKLFDWVKPKNWGIVKVYRDLENFSSWKKTIKKEERNRRSKYNQWKLNRTKLYDIYTIISLNEEDSNLAENIQRTKVIELLNPLHRYLDDELGFAECLNIEFNQFEDDEGKPTLSYLVVYRFNFNKLSLKWLIKFIVKLGILIFFIIRFDLLISLFTWVSSLI